MAIPYPILRSLADILMDTDYSTDVLAELVLESVCQQGKVMLEMLGITVSMSSLPSMKEYQQLNRWLFDNHRTVLLLKRIFTPRRYKKRWKRYLVVQLNLQQEFLNAVLEQGTGDDRKCTGKLALDIDYI